jgi:methylmalonyl-CoA mutase
VTREQWRAAVAGVLRKAGRVEGADPEDALSYTTVDGILVRPLYTRDDVAPVAPVDRAATARLAAASIPGAGAGDAAGWDIRTGYADGDPVRVNEAVLADLGGGAGSVWLTVGVRGTALVDLPRALDGVYLDLVAVVLDAGEQTLHAAQTLLALARERGIAPGELRGSFGADPIADRARTGSGVHLDHLVELTQLAAGTAMTPVTVDGTVYAEAGGSDADELAATAAAGVAYLRALSAAGVEDPFAQLDFRYSVSADQFASIAKLIAARRIWERIAELSGVAGVRQRQHAVTSSAMMTRRDPWVNLMRATVAGFAAAVGGAQSITVTPFDAALGVPDGFARRLARNTQAILHDESGLGWVLHPAGGSWYVEALTERMAEAAWEKFIVLERAGGVLAALESGALAELLTAARDRRSHDIATRTMPITGVSAFPLLVEELPSRPPAPAAPPGLLPTVRYAQAFEDLRDRVDAALAAGHRAAVPLLGLGDAQSSAARIGFARGLFQIGGIETATVHEVGDVAGAPLVCLCGSDTAYAEHTAEAVTALRAAGVGWILLASTPYYELSAAGVDGYLFTGCNVLDVLESVLKRIGVR